MTRQPHLYDDMTATVRTKQGRLWPEGARESHLSCECGEPLIQVGGFWSCPRGHGKLQEMANDPRHWAGDDEDLFTTEGE